MFIPGEQWAFEPLICVRSSFFEKREDGRSDLRRGRALDGWESGDSGKEG